MICSVLGMSDEVLRNGPALRHVHALKRRREVKPHDGRAVLLRHRGELCQSCRAISAIFAKQLNGPPANIRLRMIKHWLQTIGGEILRDVQGPERAELMRGGRGLREEFPELCGHCGIELTRSSALLEQHASTTAIPVIAVRQQADEFEIGLRGEVDTGLAWEALRREAIDAAGVFVVRGIAADFGIMPVEHIGCTIRSDLHAEAHPRVVIREKGFIAMMTDEARATGLEDVRDHIMLVKVRHEDAVAVFLRELIREVDASAAMRGAMPMIGDGLDVIEDVRIDVAAALTVIDAAGDDMPEMRDHAGGDEDLAVVIEVDSPRIAKAVRDDFKAILRGMITPNPTINVLAIFDRHLDGERIALAQDFAAIGRLAHGRACGETLAPIKPTIGPPTEAVKHFMTILNAPTGKSHFERAIGFVVLILVRHEEQIRRRAEPQSFKAHRNGRRKGNAIEEDLPRVELPVAIRVFEDQDAAVAIGGEARAACFIVTVFSNPKPPAIIPAERHRLRDHRLHRSKLRLETLRHGHFRHRLFPGKKSRLFAFRLGDIPHHCIRTLPRVGLPRICDGHIVELARIDEELMPHRLGLALGNLPIPRDRTTRSHAHLPIHTPMLRVACVLRMIKNRDVRLVLTAIQFQADIHPDRALTFGTPVTLTCTVHHAAFHPRLPRHAQKESAVWLLGHGQIHEPFTLPFKLQEITAIAIAHRPHLCLVHHRLALGIEQLINRRPLHHLAFGHEHRARHLAPEARARIVKVVASIHLLQSPVESGLMLVMCWAILGQQALAIRSHNRMEVRPKIRTRILREDCLRVVFAIDRDRVRRIILTQREHRIVGRGLRAAKKAQSKEGEEMAGFHVDSNTPFHSEIHGLGLPKVVIILPCPPNHYKAPFSPAWPIHRHSGSCLISSPTCSFL